jgi:hypothetical protein
MSVAITPIFDRIKQTKEINLSDPKYKRAGIIPFCVQNNVIFFAFGVENGVAALADFGGHREKYDTDLLDTAIREYREESLNVFGIFTRDNLLSCFVLEGKDTLEFLVKVNPPIYYYTKTFQTMVGDNSEHEVQSIVWLSRRQLFNALDSQQNSYQGTKIFHMYDRIHDTLSSYRHLL